MLTADPALEGIKRLKTDWMVGLQFYLRQRFPLTNGHANYVNSPWALTSISQGQFWKRSLSSYGDGTAEESFSTIISDWLGGTISSSSPWSAAWPWRWPD